MHKVFIVLSGVILCFFATQLNASQLFNLKTSNPLEDTNLYDYVMHDYTVLADGSILIFDQLLKNHGLVREFSKEVKLYDTKTGVMKSTGSLQYYNRIGMTVTLLKNGKVLVAGGGEDDAGQLSAEVYDPNTEQWTRTEPLCTKRRYHNAVLLKNGKVLVFGGCGDEGVMHKAEIYDPDTNTWTETKSLQPEDLYCDNTLLLKSGKIFISGGDNTAVVYDPNTEIWTKTHTISDGKIAHAVELSDNRVLVVVQGCCPTYGDCNIELYNPETKTWAHAGPLCKFKHINNIATLSDGKVLALGINSDSTTGAEVYYPTTGAWVITKASNIRAIDCYKLIPLFDGKVLAIGGDHNQVYRERNDVGISHLTTVIGKGAVLYDSKEDTWETIKTFGPYADNSYGELEAISLPGNRILVIDGCVLYNNRNKITHTYEVWSYEKSKLMAELTSSKQTYAKHANALIDFKITRETVKCLDWLNSDQTADLFKALELGIGPMDNTHMEALKHIPGLNAKLVE